MIPCQMQNDVEKRIKKKFKKFVKRSLTLDYIREDGFYTKPLTFKDCICFKNGFKQDECILILERIKNYETKDKKEKIILNILQQQFTQYLQRINLKNMNNSGEGYIIKNDLIFLCNKVLNFA